MKTLILIRGLPGSGKSSLSMLFSGVMTKRFETDQFFVKNGEYKFDATKLGIAHRMCRMKTEESMEEGCPLVIVSNTFTTEKELEPYLSLAEKYQYRIISIITENRHGNKSVHAVPEETLTKMKQRFSIQL
jgi:predicted kinase